MDGTINSAEPHENRIARLRATITMKRDLARSRFDTITANTTHQKERDLGQLFNEYRKPFHSKKLEDI